MRWHLVVLLRQREKTSPVELQGVIGVGDVWTLDADSKLMVSYMVGKREAPDALRFMEVHILCRAPNLTMHMGMRRFARLTGAFSKKIEEPSRRGGHSTSCITASAGFTKRCVLLQLWKQGLRTTFGAWRKLLSLWTTHPKGRRGRIRRDGFKDLPQTTRGTPYLSPEILDQPPENSHNLRFRRRGARAAKGGRL